MAGRVVLDTNVCLDLFVYGDPKCARLRDAMQGGAVEAVTGDDCRQEWLRVLDYPQFRIDPEQRERLIEAFDAAVRLLGPAELASPGDAVLPRCADADDQKFLELALAAGAGVLLTKDRALLKLARRTARAGLFAISRPQDWDGVTP